jgi:ABC-2 type transport system permease protein
MQRELRILSSNLFIVLMILIAPLLYPFLYNTVYSNKMEHDIDITVVDSDKSAASRQLLRDLDAHELLAVNAVCTDLSQARERLETLKTSAVIVIPEHFSDNQKTGKQVRISVLISNIRFLVTSDISRALGDVLAARAANNVLIALEKAGVNRGQASLDAQPMHPVIVPLFNTTESYGDFIIVGLILVILQQTLFMGVSAGMAMEREDNTLRHLFRTARYSIPSIILGKGGFYWILFSSLALLYCTIYFSIYSVPCTGSFFVLASLAIVHIASIITWALTISSFFKDKILAMITMLFTSYPVFFMSGYSWPNQALAPILKPIAQVLPSTPFFKAFAIVSQMNGSWQDIVPLFIHMVILFGTGLAALWLRLWWLKHTLLQTAGNSPFQKA